MFKTIQAVKFLVTAPFILLLLVIINWMTTPGIWWVKWAALGLGIAYLVNLLQVIRAIVIAGGIAALVVLIQQQRRAR